MKVEQYLDEIIKIVQEAYDTKNYNAVTTLVDVSFSLGADSEYTISSNFDKPSDEIGTIDLTYKKSSTERIDIIVDDNSICVGTYDSSSPPAKHISEYITFVKFSLSEEAFFQKSLVKNIPFSYDYLQKCATLVDKLRELRTEYDSND